MLFIILFLCGALVFGIGAFLYKTKKIEILSGYDSTKKYDREGLAKFDGKNLMYIGGSCAALGFLNLIFKYGVFFILSLGAFIILIIFFVVRSVSGSSKYILWEDENSKKEEEKRNKIVLIVVLIIMIISIVPIGIYTGLNITAKTEVSINKNEVRVKSGMQSTMFKLEDVKNVYVKNTIPKFKKVSGVNAGNINKGRFKVDGYGEGYIFIETNKGPYLYVMLNDGFVIINSKDASKVNSYYKNIAK